MSERRDERGGGDEIEGDDLARGCGAGETTSLRLESDARYTYTHTCLLLILKTVKTRQMSNARRASERAVAHSRARGREASTTRKWCHTETLGGGFARSKKWKEFGSIGRVDE